MPNVLRSVVVLFLCAWVTPQESGAPEVDQNLDQSPMDRMMKQEAINKHSYNMPQEEGGPSWGIGQARNLREHLGAI